MYDTADDVLAFHDSEVTLPQAERTAMRDRRNANRDRLESRLEEKGRPLPEEFIKQGSYAMLTMVQDSEKDYDIDDGVYFPQSDLKERDGSPMSAQRIKEIVCDALKDDRFNKQPKVKAACVRIFYDEGYHVDMPIYRIRSSDGQYELAADGAWTVSRAADVEEWFDRQNAKSPDTDNGRQLRRIVRCIKKFGRSRKDWKGQCAPGFAITKLVSECYIADGPREDVALRQTMAAIRDRLCRSLEVMHPVTPGAKLTKGPDDAETAFLRDKLEDALSELVVLDDSRCTPKQAASAWDRVFNTGFFSGRLSSKIAKAAESGVGSVLGVSTLRAPVASAGLSFPDKPVVPNKPAGFA
jgi:hypothetical protein